jgi:hypothetical protein
VAHHPIICLTCKHHLDVRWNDLTNEYDWVSIGTHSAFCAGTEELHVRGRAEYTIPDIEPYTEEQEYEEHMRDIDHLWRNR